MRDSVFEESYEESFPAVNDADPGTIAERCFRSANIARETVTLTNLLTEKTTKNEVFCSFELFPVEKHGDFYQRFFVEMEKFSPLFYALTWNNKSSSSDYLSLELVKRFPSNTLLHLAAGCLNNVEVDMILKTALHCGVTNIFALRGDYVTGNGNFPHAVDLVKFIRKRFGNKFSICVAGYPEMHPESRSKELDLLYLKDKVDMGANFIITQIFFEPDTFINFVKDCRQIGIEVPIIPGIFPFANYKCLEKMTKICKIQIPKKVLDALEPIKHNDEAVKNYGIHLATNLIKEILENGASKGFHLFTLNRTTLATEICNGLDREQV